MSGGWIRPHRLLVSRGGITAMDGHEMESQRRRQMGELSVCRSAQRHQHGVMAGAFTNGRGLNGTASQMPWQQTDEYQEAALHETHAPAQPAQGPWQFDIQAQGICGGLKAWSAFDYGHDMFEFIEGARQPRCQTIRQQAEGHVAFRTVPAGDPRPRRRLAGVGAVAGQGTSAPRMIRTARKACFPPGLAANVFLAGVPRMESKLHRPRPGGGHRAGHFLSDCESGFGDYRRLHLRGSFPSSSATCAGLPVAYGIRPLWLFNSHA